MRVLTIMNSASMGGVEKTLLSCLKNIEKEKIDMTILCFRSGGKLEDDFKKLGVKFLYIKKTGLILLDMIQLFFILLKHKFDVIHSRFGFTSGGFVLAAKLSKTKIYVSLHSTEPSTFKNFQRNKMLYRALSFHLRVHKYITKNLANKIIGHSKANLNINYPNWESNPKFKLIYNGIDFQMLDNDIETSSKLDKFIKKGDFIILHIGSFREAKNHSFLIDCFNALNPIENNYKLILVGSGNLSETIKEKVKKLNLSENVFFSGFDQNINKYLEISNLFFLPSINEGLANVLIEAQYKNLPICVADIPPLYESGYMEYHKYYFNPKDRRMAIESLKKTICDTKNGNLDSTVKKAKNYVMKNFSIQSMVANLINVYHEK